MPTSAKKLLERPSPPFHAGEHKEETKTGNDGNEWKSIADVRGIYHWKRVTSASSSSSAKKKTSAKKPTQSKKQEPASKKKKTTSKKKKKAPKEEKEEAVIKVQVGLEIGGKMIAFSVGKSVKAEELVKQARSEFQELKKVAIDDIRMTSVETSKTVRKNQLLEKFSVRKFLLSVK